MSKKGQTFSDTRLFTPSVIRGLAGETPVSDFVTAADLSGSIQDTTSSFVFDTPGTGLKNTQQIPLDWARFENHTFFNSAESKVNVAFDTIINRFPFDGTKDEHIQFFNNLTGFEKYVYDSFPKYTGYLNFSGSSEIDSEVGTYINVKDIQGTLYPTLSRKRKESGVLNPNGRSFSTEMFLYVPSGTINGNQVILQKYNDSETSGITLGVSSSRRNDSPLGECDIVMLVTSGTFHLSASMTVEKGSFNHICCVWNRIPSKNIVQMYNNFELMGSSPYSNELSNLNFNSSPLLIGSGSKHYASHFDGSTSDYFTPTETLSGSIDELRIWHAIKKPDAQRKWANETLYAQRHLALYYRFNEPTGSHTGNDIVLDSSGNSLHSNVGNYVEGMRITGSLSSMMMPGLRSPMLQEMSKYCPILFPSHHKLVDLNTSLLFTASSYDANNPNLITRLVPNHYLQEATYFEGHEDDSAQTGDVYSTATDFPGGGKIGSPQIIASVLFTWAKFFDELKVYLDQMGNALAVDHITEGTVADQFLPFLARYYGFDLPNMFSDSSIRQYTEGMDLTIDKAISQHPLQYIQNQIWRRILTDVLEIVRTKGTLRSIRAAFLNMGINPEKGFRFREYGGRRFRVLSDVREMRVRGSRLLSFSGSLTERSDIESVDAQGLHANRPFLQTNFLSSSRVEPGKPTAKGYSGQVHPVTGTNEPSDGLLTSGSWTYEGLYRFIERYKYVRPMSQSLARIMTTGSYSTDGTTYNMHHVLANLVGIAEKKISAKTASVQFYVNPSVTSSYSQISPGERHGALHLILTGVNIFDGNLWHISAGRVRSDLTGTLNSSSYFLRAGRQAFGKISEYFYTEEFFDDHHNTNYFETLSADHNASGSFIVIGSQSISIPTSSVGLNNKALLGDGANESSNDYNRSELCTNFDGEVGHIRLWSKALTINEDREHVRNFNSLGVKDPTLNFNFEKSRSGSFEKLRMNLTTEQPIITTDSSGEIDFIDYSQNSINAVGKGFEATREVCKSIKVSYSQLTTRIDEPTTNEKVRPRSFINEERAKFKGVRRAPVHSLVPSEQILDDSRFSIEVSSVQALNDDIVNIFSTLRSLDDIIGRPEYLFSPDYPDLESLREIYFNRLTDKLNIKKFFDFFKWFDTSMGTLIERLVPRKTDFLGVNFVIEPHMLERAKFHYNSADMYLGEYDRQRGRDTLMLQQLLAQIRKY